MPQSAIAAALRRLGQRPYTAHEIAQYLVTRHYEQGEVAQALARLGELGYLDDLEAARATVRYRLRHPRGRRLVAQELYRRGIDQETVSAALADYDEAELARALAERLERQGKSGEALHRALASRGFSPAAIPHQSSGWPPESDIP